MQRAMLLQRRQTVPRRVRTQTRRRHWRMELLRAIARRMQRRRARPQRRVLTQMALFDVDIISRSQAWMQCKSGYYIIALQGTGCATTHSSHLQLRPHVF